MLSQANMSRPTVIDEDRPLFDAWVDGDRRAGNALLTKHYVRIRRFFLSKDESHYQDLTSRTFEECIKSRDNFRGEASFRTYLFAIALRVLCRHLRELRRRDVEEFVFATEQARMLMSCLRRLSLNAQIVLELRYWTDLSEPEIQRILKLRTREAVAGRLRIARDALRREWARVKPGHTLADADFADWMSEIRQHIDSQNPQGL
jgi:RNA polymerase sigma factor (sigma-70 family)